jgi:CRISPR-associated endonuclease Csn1
LIRFRDGTPVGIERAGVRHFDAGVLGDIESGRDESRATQRRDARGPRRQHWRRQWRLRRVFRLLGNNGLIPKCDDAPEARHLCIQELDRQLRREFGDKGRVAAHLLPYRLRAAALDPDAALTPHALGRALYHLAQRRGFQSNRKAARHDEDSGIVKQGIAELTRRMSESGARTLGEYFAAHDPEEQRIRARWTSRQMYRDEFELIWQAQQTLHPTLTKELHDALGAAIFSQRPLKSQKNLIGRCDLHPEKRRAPLACMLAQRFRLLQRVNDLRVIAPDGEVRPLRDDERTKLIAALDREGDLTWTAIRKLLGLRKSKEYERNWAFNFEEGGDKKLIGNRTGAKLASLIGEQWTVLAPERQERLVDEVLSFESVNALAQRLESAWNLSPSQAAAVADVLLEPGYAALSRKAVRELLPLMERGEPFATARKRVYGQQLGAVQGADLLPPLSAVLPQLRNPAVARALAELRKVVNAVIRGYGKPEMIRVELARDLKHARKRRKEMTQQRDANTDARDDARKRILSEFHDRYGTPENILKVRLAEECNWQCPFTGRSFGLSELVGDHPQYDVEHIIPFSRSLDNSFLNKTLCYHDENRSRKRNRTPFEAYHGTSQWDDIIGRVRRFQGTARRRKLALFMTETLPDPDEFAQKLLSDTRYISRAASQYVGVLYGGKADADGRQRVQVSPGRATAYLRQRWNLNSIIGHADEKNRADHRHHAIDALVIALADPGAVRLLAHAAEEAEKRGDSRLFADVAPPWNEFLDQARAAILRVTVSYRVNRKLNGPLHKDTIFSKPLSVPGDSQGATCHHVRKRLDDMSRQEAEAIVDDRVRVLVLERLDEVGGDPKKAFTDPANHPVIVARDGRRIPIHKARVRKSDRPIQVGDGARRRYVNPGSNHHLEIVAVLDDTGVEKRWEGVLVSRFEAVRRKRAGEPVVCRDHDPNRKFLFSLAGGEYVAMNYESDCEGTYRVTVISDGQIEFSLHSDARPETLRRKLRGARIRCSPDSLRKNGARKVVVDPLGRLQPAAD